ncbi:MAG: cation diffusion facilitator family transporter [Thermodesulfobacteriota bacterium]
MNIPDCSFLHDAADRIDAGHEHRHGAPAEKDAEGFRLLITMALNLIIPVAQVIGGIAANSMALISDAVHNFSDFTVVLISYIAFRVGRRGATVFNTFGYRRAEILAALINVMLLAGASGLILYHAVLRFLTPQPVNGSTVVILAAVGVTGNGLSAWLLHRDAANSLNIRGAFLHMVGDLLTSVVVLMTGVIFLFYPWYWLDPLLSLAIVFFILKNGWGLFKEAAAVLMNATPVHIRLEEVRSLLEKMSGVAGVHYLHAWQVSSASIAFSCHVVVPDQPVSRTGELAERIRRELLHRFGIDHPVLQFETADCGRGTLLCEMACNGSGGCKPENLQGEHTRKDSSPSPVEKIMFVVLRLFLGGVFLYASYDKIIHPQAFAQAVCDYQILPDVLISPAALILPWVELLIGLCLVAGFWLPGAVGISTGLMTIFIAALAFNLARGLNIHCGCFSTEATEGPADLWTIARDVSFLIVSLVLAWLVFFKPGKNRPHTERR